MTAKTSISPSAQATTAGAEASVPPSGSGSAQAPEIQAACQRARSSSTQNRSRRPGPQVVAASPRGTGGRSFGSVSVMASDDTRSSGQPTGVGAAIVAWRQGVGSSAGEGTADGPLRAPGALSLGELDL